MVYVHNGNSPHYTMSASGTVLVVDDDPTVVNAYAIHLRDRYTVRTAHSGQEALESLDEAVDVLLLDRKMPDVSGDDILETIRDRGLNCRVAMVTAVPPDVDIIEMGFDDYLVKPASEATLLSTVESLLARTTYDTQMQEYFSLVSKRSVLTQRNCSHDLRDNDEYRELVDRIDHLETVLDDTLSQLDDRDAFLLFDR